MLRFSGHWSRQIAVCLHTPPSVVAVKTRVSRPGLRRCMLSGDTEGSLDCHTGSYCVMGQHGDTYHTLQPYEEENCSFLHP